MYKHKSLPPKNQLFPPNQSSGRNTLSDTVHMSTCSTRKHISSLNDKEEVEIALRQVWSKLYKTCCEPFIKIAQEQNEKNFAAFQETQQQMSKSKSNGPPPTSEVRGDGCDAVFRASTPISIFSAYDVNTPRTLSQPSRRKQ